jgi:hypothetical protein
MMLLIMWSELRFIAGCLVTDELERIWMETLWYNLSYHHGIGLEGLRDITKTLMRVAAVWCFRLEPETSIQIKWTSDHSALIFSNINKPMFVVITFILLG